MKVKHFLTKTLALFYALTNRERADLMKIKTDHLTYLAAKDLFNLYEAARSIERVPVRGLFIEAGCALGGSAIAIGKAKHAGRPFRIYDVFGLIPPPSQGDDINVHARYREIKAGKSVGIDGNPYYGYTKNLQDVVVANLTRHGVPPETNNIKLIKGRFEDMLSVDEPVAFAHVDCDWYQSVMTCLERIVPNLVPGGKMIFDDYYEWSGCRHAVDEYFSTTKAGYRFATVGKKLHVDKLPQ